MSMDNPHAAGQGGTEPEPQSRTSAQPDQPSQAAAIGRKAAAPTDPPDDAPPDDDTQRRRVADRLAGLLELNCDLATVCETLAAAPKKGRLEAVYAAARLTQANAQLGRSIAQLVQVEQRKKTIIQHIQPPRSVSNDSNSSAQGALIDALMAKMLLYMNVVAGEMCDPALEQADAAAKAQLAPAT